MGRERQAKQVSCAIVQEIWVDYCPEFKQRSRRNTHTSPECVCRYAMLWLRGERVPEPTFSLLGTKAYNNKWARSVAIEVEQDGVEVLSITPAFVVCLQHTVLC